MTVMKIYAIIYNFMMKTSRIMKLLMSITRPVYHNYLVNVMFNYMIKVSYRQFTLLCYSNLQIFAYTFNISLNDLKHIPSLMRVVEQIKQE